MSLWPTVSWWNSRMTVMPAQIVSQLLASFCEYDSSEADKTAWRRTLWLVLPTTCSGIIFTCDCGFLVAVLVITWPGRLIKPGTQEETVHFCALLAQLYTIAVVLDLKNAARAPTGWRGTLMAERWIQFCQHYFRFSALPQSLNDRKGSVLWVEKIQLHA
jgi:hypothetical protein